MFVYLNYQRLVCFRIKLWKRRKHLLAKDNRHVFQTRGRDTGPLQNLKISKNGNTGNSQHHGSHLLIGKMALKREKIPYTRRIPNKYSLYEVYMGYMGLIWYHPKGFPTIFPMILVFFLVEAKTGNYSLADDVWKKVSMDAQAPL